MNQSSIQTLQQAVVAHRLGDLRKAERLYKTIIASRSSRVKSGQEADVIALAYNNLGFAQQQSGNLDDAIDSYEHAVEVKPDNYEAHHNLGYTLALSGHPGDAVDCYKEAIKLKPDFIEAYYHMGHALQEKGDLRASADCYRQIIKMQPGNADAYNALGAVLQIKGELDAALESYEHVLKINPDYFEAYNNMGSAYQAKGELEAAIECFENALERNPEYANAYNNMGHARFAQGNFQAAIQCYERAVELLPDSAEPYNNLANAYRETGNFDEALKYFQILEEPRFAKAFEVSPSKPLYWLNAKSQVLECLFSLGRYEELERSLNRLGESGDLNRRVAAVGSYVAHQLEIENPLPFCKNPLDFIYQGNLADHVDDMESLVAGLIEEGDQESQVWEPIHGVTKSGYATANTIFHAGRYARALEGILRKEVESYRSRYESSDCAYIDQWPSEYDLKGWFVRLVKNGFQRSHIHPAGWLSGVVYLKTLESSETDEGGIEFGLHGLELPVLDDSYPRRVHRPRRGEILLFPSSLFHRTLPFSQDTDRCVIAFDLHPK